MKHQYLKIMTLLVLTFIGLQLGLALAGTKSQKTATLKESYVWYDGKNERQVWLDPSLVAEFQGGSGYAAKSAIKSLYSDAVPVSTHGAVRLWRLGQGVNSGTVVRALSNAGQGSYSPVLRDGPTTASRKRALPGNIIVYLDSAWDSATVNSWVAQHKLEIVKKLEIGPNIYVIKTGPGLEALNTANALFKSGEVIAAFPDWWEEATKR